VAFGWSDELLYVFQIRGWRFGDPARAIELELAGGGVDMPLAAFAFELKETFQYHYNLFVPWKIDCRIESRSLVPADEPLGCLAARGDPPGRVTPRMDRSPAPAVGSFVPRQAILTRSFVKSVWSLQSAR
jgi:hypothetical protein